MKLEGTELSAAQTRAKRQHQEAGWLELLSPTTAEVLNNAWDVLVLAPQQQSGRPSWRSYVLEIHTHKLPRNFGGE